MWPTRARKLEALKLGLAKYSKHRTLLGISSDAARDALTMQMIASLRRLDYTAILRGRSVTPHRAEPSSDLFDPERAAIWHVRRGDLDEAVWIVFLSTHFGKHVRHGWRRLRDVYSGLGHKMWTWNSVSSNPDAFRAWLSENETKIGGAFGNHRKYESLGGDSANGTGAVIASYIDWLGPSHKKVFDDLIKLGGNDPEKIFAVFYSQMKVHRFGRLGKFDFLAMLGRLGLAPIVPDSAYLAGATGPLQGARLLFSGDRHAKVRVADLERWLKELDQELGIGMQAMEDSLCNWQKSPTSFVHFKG
jgi:hypothetical protein